MVCNPFYYLRHMKGRTWTESMESQRKGADRKAAYGPLSLEDEGEGESKLSLGLGVGTPFIEEY